MSLSSHPAILYTSSLTQEAQNPCRGIWAKQKVMASYLDTEHFYSSHSRHFFFRINELRKKISLCPYKGSWSGPQVCPSTPSPDHCSNFLHCAWFPKSLSSTSPGFTSNWVAGMQDDIFCHPWSLGALCCFHSYSRVLGRGFKCIELHQDWGINKQGALICPRVHSP